MCPEKPTISAYHDGELEGDVRAFVARHLRECAECSRVLDEYRALSVSLSEAGDAPWENATARSREHIRARAAIVSGVALWGRTVRVPFPLAAAAAVAIVVLAVGLLLSLQHAGRRGASPTGTPVALSVSAFEDVVKFLDSRQREQPVVFRLPEHAQLRVISEPTFVRAADYRRGFE